MNNTRLAATRENLVLLMIGLCGPGSRESIKSALLGWRRLSAWERLRRVDRILDTWDSAPQPWRIVVINASNTFGLIPEPMAGEANPELLALLEADLVREWVN